MQVVRYMLNDIKTAAVIATGTTTSGVASTFLEYIPDGIGKLATVVGILLSIVLIYSHIRKGITERKQAAIVYERSKLELAILREKERKRLDSIEKRQRRKEDTSG